MFPAGFPHCTGFLWRKSLPPGGRCPRRGRMRGRAPVCSEPAGERPPAAYFPARESRQSSPWGNRRGKALLGPNAPVSPWYPLSRTRAAAAKFNYLPSLKLVACRFGALRAVPLLPEQRYPPRLVSPCNSITFLNAARSFCAVSQSAPERVRRPAPKRQRPALLTVRACHYIMAVFSSPGPPGGP